MDASAKIACCKICLLSQAMKDCKHCAFNIGLTVKAEQGSAEQTKKQELKP